MLRADPVMDADQPRLEVGEDQMDDRQELLDHLWISACGNSVVIIAALAQAGVAAPIIRDDQVLGATAPSTNPQSDLALRSAATASRTRPA